MRGATTGLLGLGALVLFSGTSAAAGPADECLTVPVEGQKLRNDRKLVDARDKFAICSHKTCPAEIVQSCMRWGAEVQGAIPSVVIAARDSRGQDLGDVHVSIDGWPPVDVTPRAIELDPGAHRFVFHRSGRLDVAQQVILRDGEKNREVSVAFEPSPAPAVVPPSLPVPDRTSRSGDVPAMSWVLGGVGVAAFGVASYFWVSGLSERSNMLSTCAATSTCSSSAVSSARQAPGRRCRGRCRRGVHRGRGSPLLRVARRGSVRTPRRRPGRLGRSGARLALPLLAEACVRMTRGSAPPVLA
jgi:hypothetical protein